MNERANLDGVVKPANGDAGTWKEKLTRNDPDLKCPEHDAMSIAMVDWSFCANMLASAGISVFKVVNVELEYPITKGVGQYRTLIGFSDALVEAVCRLNSSPVGRVFVIEAKPHVDNPMEVMRQLKTYLTFVRESKSLLWCPNLDQQIKKVFVANKLYVCSETIDSLRPI